MRTDSLILRPYADRQADPKTICGQVGWSEDHMRTGNLIWRPYAHRQSDPKTICGQAGWSEDHMRTGNLIWRPYVDRQADLKTICGQTGWSEGHMRTGRLIGRMRRAGWSWACLAGWSGDCATQTGLKTEPCRLIWRLLRAGRSGNYAMEAISVIVVSIWRKYSFPVSRNKRMELSKNIQFQILLVFPLFSFITFISFFLQRYGETYIVMPLRL